MTSKVVKSDKEWQQKLTPQQYSVCRQKGTESPFSGKFWDHHEEGTYLCVGCGGELFHSGDKFDSGTGWPSFFQPAREGVVRTAEDQGHGVKRTEVLCQGCGAHLGHVFEDGPKPTGLRYCINSVALRFQNT